jgi:uncharacterized protein YggE
MTGRVSTLAVLLAAALAAPSAAQEAPKGPEISVTGTGTVTVSPDYAVVQLTVATRDAEAARAGQANARAMTAVRGALRSLLNVPDDSLPTVSYAVGADYDRGRPVGYQARSDLKVTVHDLARVGAVIDAALGAGANSVSQLQFESTKEEAARLEALGQAVQSARRQAEAMARAAGGRLGPLLSVASSGPIHLPGPQMAMRAMAAETPVEAPALEVTAMVNARWAFIPQ